MGTTTTSAKVTVCSTCRAYARLHIYPSPFPDGFNRGYDTPSATTVSDLVVPLATAQWELETITSDIQDFETTLTAFRLHRAHLTRYIKQAKTYTSPSPIRRLPTEILQLIFTAACDSFERAEYKTPLSISLVCSKWRDVALSNQILWTHIYVSDDSQRGILDLYLSRCPDPDIHLFMKVDLPKSPLPYDDDDDDQDIDIDDDGRILVSAEPEVETGRYRMYEEYISKFLWPVFKTAARWRHAELRMRARDFESWSFKYIGEDTMPHLDSLTLAFKDNCQMRDLRGVWRRAPSLRSLVVLNRPGRGVLWVSPTTRPWSRLRHIETDQQDLYHLAHLHRAFRVGSTEPAHGHGHGRCLTISASRVLKSAPDAMTFRISALVLQPGVWTEGLVEFLQCLSIPTLVDLTLVSLAPNAVRGRWENALSAVPAFLDRSTCELKGFTFIMHGIYEDTDAPMTTQPSMPDTLMTALQHMPALERLKIVEAASGPRLISDSLVERMLNEEGFMSGVTSLELVWGEDRTPSWNVLMAMIASRVERKVRLSSVVLGLRNGGDMDPQIQSFLCGLREDGIDARLW